MFYFDTLYGQKILKSNYIENILAFFTTRETDEEELLSKISADRIIKPEQTHSKNVEIITKKDDYPNTDGLILTNDKDLICLKFADCTPLIFYDRKQKVAACSHAGWHGTAQKIGIETVLKMQNECGCNIKDIVVLIGPAISKCCYEVSVDVKKQLLATVKDTTDLYKENRIDLKSINARQLQELGIEKIDICPYCTSCNNDLFYSYRKENGTPNRHKAIVKIR